MPMLLRFLPSGNQAQVWDPASRTWVNTMTRVVGEPVRRVELPWDEGRLVEPGKKDEASTSS